MAGRLFVVALFASSEEPTLAGLLRLNLGIGTVRIDL